MSQEDGKPQTHSLHDRHVAAGAKIADVAGWRVPMLFSTLTGEVVACRTRAGVFDLSHLGRIRIRGDGALPLLEKVFTADVAHQEDDTALPTLACTQHGSIMDIGRLLRLEDCWIYISHPHNRVKMLEHLTAVAQTEGLAAKVDDQTAGTTQLAVIGPTASQLLDSVLPEKVSDKPDGFVKVGSFMIARYVAIRASFCDLWGLQVIIPNMLAGQAWKFITEKAGDKAVTPVGMGAMDILRMEAGLPEYGRDLNETIDPISAGLAGLVDLSHEFIGCNMVQKVADRGATRKIVAMVAADMPANATRIPRQGDAVTQGKDDQLQEVGQITSATFSPTLERPIALANILADAAEVGTVVNVQHNEGCDWTVTAPPLIAKPA